jgi:hypothetical protein
MRDAVRGGRVNAPRRGWYRGVHFRSTLEADWAATLDQYGITWQYEVEAYVLPDGYAYSPDLWLPAQRTWLEVKGPHYARVDKFEAFKKILHSVNGAEIGLTLGHLPEDWDSPDLVQAYLALPSEHGLARLETAVFFQCVYCDHHVITWSGSHRCRVCWRPGGLGDPKPVKFKRARDYMDPEQVADYLFAKSARARDDDPPRVG